MNGTGKKRAAAGAGIVGVAALGATYFFADGDDVVPANSDLVELEAEATATRPSMDTMPVASAASTFCAPAVIAGDGCAERDAIASQVPALFRSDAMPARPVRLVEAEGEGEEEVADCQRYGELRRAGYGAATSAGMAREAQLSRVCGLVLIAGQAAPASAPSPGERFVNQIPRSELPVIGERRFGSDAELSVLSRDPLVWQIEDEAQRAELLYVGTADFDGDGEAEYLMEWRLEAKGGTFRAIGYGLAELRPAGFRTIDPYSLP
jgi:hypothetical protein